MVAVATVIYTLNVPASVSVNSVNGLELSSFCPASGTSGSPTLVSSLAFGPINPGQASTLPSSGGYCVYNSGNTNLYLTSADIIASTTALTPSSQTPTPLPTGITFSDSLAGSLFCGAGQFCNTYVSKTSGTGNAVPVTFTITIAGGTSAQDLSFYVNINGQQ